jgi:hypothetical protein
MRDERGLVGRAAITLLVLIIVGGLAAVDSTAVLFAHLQASDVSDTAANAGATSYENTHNFKVARIAADEAAKEQDSAVKVVKFSVNNRGWVTVTVEKMASTFLVKRVGFLRHFGQVEETSSAGP